MWISYVRDEDDLIEARTFDNKGSDNTSLQQYLCQESGMATAITITSTPISTERTSAMGITPGA